MPLNDMSLEELKIITSALVTLEQVGGELAEQDLHPTFNLTPGQQVIITVPFALPEAPGRAIMEDVARIEAKLDRRLAMQENAIAASMPGSILDLVRQIMADNPIAASMPDITADLVREMCAAGATPYTQAALIKKTSAVPTRNWTKTEEQLVALIYARIMADGPQLDPSYEAAAAVGKPRAEVSDYTRAYLMDLIDTARADLVPTPSTEAAPPEPAPEPVDPPPAVEGPAGGDPQSSAVPSSAAGVASPPPEATGDILPQVPEAPAVGAAEDSGGGQQLAAAPSPAAPAADLRNPAPVPGSASALAAQSQGNPFASPPWTEEEDARLIALVVRGTTGLGLSRRQAIMATAQEMGRPFQGAEFRCRSKLRGRLDAAIAEADACRVAQPVDLDAKSRAAAIAHGNVPESAVAGEGSGSFIADPVTAHIMALTNKGGWTIDRDLELLELSIAGWPPHEIALQIQMQANTIKPRFDALTGLYTDDNDKKQRRFTREAVFEALTRLAGKVA